MAQSYGEDFAPYIHDFTYQLINYITFLKEDYYVGKKIRNRFDMSGCNTYF
jgi:hypothetical protein